MQQRRDMRLLAALPLIFSFSYYVLYSASFSVLLSRLITSCRTLSNTLSSAYLRWHHFSFLITFVIFSICRITVPVSASHYFLHPYCTFSNTVRTQTIICTNILLGSKEDAADAALLKSWGVTHVLNVAKQVPNYHEDTGKFVYMKIALIGTWSLNTFLSLSFFLSYRPYYLIYLQPTFQYLSIPPPSKHSPFSPYLYHHLYLTSSPYLYPYLFLSTTVYLPLSLPFSLPLLI